jgi:hypothetical protein
MKGAVKEIKGAVNAAIRNGRRKEKRPEEGRRQKGQKALAVVIVGSAKVYGSGPSERQLSKYRCEVRPTSRATIVLADVDCAGGNK